MRNRIRAGAAGVVALSLLLAGVFGLQPTGAGAQATASVRLAHMVPGAPAVDVYVNGQRAFDGLAFKGTTEYASVPAGQPNIRMARDGDPQAVLAEVQLNVQGGRQYTAIATLVSGMIAPLVLTDDNTPPPAGNANVRFVHASPDAPAVDIAARGGPVLFSNISYRNTGQYRAVPAGTYTLDVRPAGQTTVALSVPNVEPRDGQILTIIGAGQLADNSFAAVPVLYTTAGAAQTAPPGGIPRSGVGQFADPAFTSSSWLILAAIAALAGAAVLIILRPRMVAAADSARLDTRMSTALGGRTAATTALQVAPSIAEVKAVPTAFTQTRVAIIQPSELSHTIQASVEEALRRIAAAQSVAEAPKDYIPKPLSQRALTVAPGVAPNLAEEIAFAIRRWIIDGRTASRGRRTDERS